ncbi:hypothetical protein BGZ72_009999, partial [Mortierella alpina]
MPLHEYMYMRLKEMQPEELSNAPNGHNRLLAKKFQVAAGIIRANWPSIPTAPRKGRQSRRICPNQLQAAIHVRPAVSCAQTAAPKQKSVLDGFLYLDKWLAVA